MRIGPSIAPQSPSPPFRRIIARTLRALVRVGNGADRPHIPCMSSTSHPQRDPVGPGQVSVWDFPRPAIAEATDAHVKIEHAGTLVADSRATVRTLETSHPPSYYIPRADIAPGVLRKAQGSSFCEWKGVATYWDVVIGDLVLPGVGWSYPEPTPAFEILRDHVAFYAAPFDRCSVDGATVTPQPGGFYGGWITEAFAGPFKGGPGSRWW